MWSGDPEPIMEPWHAVALFLGLVAAVLAGAVVWRLIRRARDRRRARSLLGVPEATNLALSMLKGLVLLAADGGGPGTQDHQDRQRLLENALCILAMAAMLRCDRDALQRWGIDDRQWWEQRITEWAERYAADRTLPNLTAGWLERLDTRT